MHKRNLQQQMYNKQRVMYRFFLLSLNRMSMSERFHRFRVWLLDAPQYMYINKYSSNNNHYHHQYPLVVNRGKGKRM